MASSIPFAQLSLLNKYANNIAKDPTNPKYRKIRLANAKFQEVWAIEEAQALLSATGWSGDVEEGYLVLPGEVDHTILSQLVGELMAAQPQQPQQPQAQFTVQLPSATATATATATAPARTAPAKKIPAKISTEGMNAKEKEFHESRQKALQAAKRAKDEKKRIRAQIDADREHIAKRKLKDSKAKEKKFGANINRYGDIGVDLNSGGG